MIQSFQHKQLKMTPHGFCDVPSKSFCHMCIVRGLLNCGSDRHKSISNVPGLRANANKSPGQLVSAKKMGLIFGKNFTSAASTFGARDGK